ncbi:MAG: MarR family winged helix-turn-helix transcriptional regulator [Steroidobacteraceae bacterium]
MTGTDESIGFLLGDVMRLMRAEFNRRAEHHGVTLAQAKALLRLAREPGLRQVELAGLLEIAPMTLVRVLDQLVEAGHVERRPDPADRRAFRLYVTPAARPALARIDRAVREVRDLALGNLSRSDHAALLRALARIKRNLAGGAP